MLIVLGELLELVLMVGETRIYTQIPVCPLCQVAWLLRSDWLWDMKGRVVFIAWAEPVGSERDAVLCSSGVWEYPAMLHL